MYSRSELDFLNQDSTSKHWLEAVETHYTATDKEHLSVSKSNLLGRTFNVLCHSTPSNQYWSQVATEVHCTATDNYLAEESVRSDVLPPEGASKTNFTWESCSPYLGKLSSLKRQTIGYILSASKLSA